ncbi:MAG: hypothetical protein QG665_22 [Patescibacteria group bacterium]|nr:hypothetical protein [Patescibacteria group bacterium]
MITLIGTRCKHRKVFSRGVLIRPFLLGNLEINPLEGKTFNGKSFDCSENTMLFLKLNLGFCVLAV